MSKQSSLAGRHIVITRPAAQAGALKAAIEAEAGIAVVFPVLEIRPLEDTAPLFAVARRLDDYAFACFVSPNAIEHALDVVLAERRWPQHLRALVMGPSSRAALSARGIYDVVAPSGRYDSEALLALPELAEQEVRGKRVVVFRGEGGRELLGETLAARGAAVDYIASYRRSCPAADPGPLIELAARNALDAVTITSSEGMSNFVAMLGEAAHAVLPNTTFFVPHARIAEAARTYGITHVVQTGPADAGLLAGLTAYFETTDSR